MRNMTAPEICSCRENSNGGSCSLECSCWGEGDLDLSSLKMARKGAAESATTRASSSKTSTRGAASATKTTSSVLLLAVLMGHVVPTIHGWSFLNFIGVSLQQLQQPQQRQSSAQAQPQQQYQYQQQQLGFGGGFSRWQSPSLFQSPFSPLAQQLQNPSSPGSGNRNRRGRGGFGGFNFALSATARPPLLNEWTLLSNGRVKGVVQDHPTIPDGETITTSPISKPEVTAQKRGRVVQTLSGTKYQLGDPKMETMNNGKKVSLQELQRRARVKLGLTGEIVGDDTRQYLLAGKPAKSTSGKSRIYKAYRADEDGLPTGEPLLVKISNNWEAIEREASNYSKITKAGVTRGQFVQLSDFLPTASLMTKKFRNQSALVMERGSIDLKRYIAINGALKGKELRNAAASAAQCLQAVHDSGLVWTDMKTENFIVTEEGKVKGIDLESAMPARDNPVDYSPEATPPEFARAFLAGDGPYFILDYNYDMWSFGMLLYELATGRGYFDGKTPMQITKILRSGPEIDLSDIDIDPKLKDLISSCLNLNPRQRPSVVQILLHPYFLTTGLGPFSLF